MANISSLISLDKFVRGLFVKTGEDNEQYLRVMQIACDGLRDMYIHDFEIQVTKKVTVDGTTNTFDYPTDYVRYTAIATPIDGRWWVYTRDDEMAPLKDDDDVAVQSSLPNIANYNVFESFGEAGGYNKYYFHEDAKNRRFQVGGYTPDTVVLKYVTNGLDSDGDINIPDYAKLALEDYVRWKIADYDEDAESHIVRLYNQYLLSRRKMRQVKRPTLQDLVDACYASSGALQR